jgi:hypothetical protein
MNRLSAGRRAARGKPFLAGFDSLYPREILEVCSILHTVLITNGQASQQGFSFGRLSGYLIGAKSREVLPAQPVDATPYNQLI